MWMYGTLGEEGGGGGMERSSKNERYSPSYLKAIEVGGTKGIRGKGPQQRSDVPQS